MNNTNSNTSLIVVTIIAVAVIAAVTALLIFQPNSTGIPLILGFAGMLISQVLTNRSTDAKIKETNKKVDDVHTIINSRLTELLAATSAASKAEGMIEGAKTEKAQTKADNS